MKKIFKSAVVVIIAVWLVQAVAVGAVSSAIVESNNGQTSYCAQMGIINRVLRIGHTGEDVKILQNILKEINYFSYPNSTGIFGNITRLSVIKFQTTHELKVDGVVGKKTLNKLRMFVCDTENSVQAPFTTSITSSTTSVTTVHDDNRQSSTIWLPRKKGTTIISSNAGDVIAPVVAITEPTGSATVSGTVTLLALASDNIGISSVQFQVNGSDIGERVTSAPFTLDWDTSHSEDGAYILTAVARDAAGNQTISEAVTVEVDNLPTTYTLTTVRSGSGVGIITSSPAGINCGSSCSAVFNSGGHISLTPMAGAGSVFIGWSGGGCAGTGICTVTLDSDTTVTAQFALNDFALTVNSAGSGSGIVTSIPAGIACGSTCVANFAYGTMISLIASPGPGSNFAGWGGSCSGLGACVVTMTAANNVTALFSAVP